MSNERGLWIKLHISVFKHEKTLRVAEILRLQPIYAAAHLIALWTWALANRDDGNLEGLSAKQIALAAEYAGDETKFVDALKAAKYLDMDFKLHNWAEYAGKYLENKKAHAEYMKAWRLLPPEERVRRKSVKTRKSGFKTFEEKRAAQLHLLEMREKAAKSNGKHN